MSNSAPSIQKVHAKNHGEEHELKPGAVLPAATFALSKIIVMRPPTALPTPHPNNPSSTNVTKSVPDRDFEPSLQLRRKLSH